MLNLYASHKVPFLVVMESNLPDLQDGYIRQDLSAARIDEALIHGIGPKLKERRAA